MAGSIMVGDRTGIMTAEQNPDTISHAVRRIHTRGLPNPMTGINRIRPTDSGRLPVKTGRLLNRIIPSADEMLPEP